MEVSLLSRDDIRYGYRFLLGREPESEQAYENHAKAADIAALRRNIMMGGEFNGIVATMPRYSHKLKDVTDCIEDELIYFIHVPKTGGTTLQHVLVAGFPREKIAPANNILALSVGEVLKARFIGGHFSYAATTLIPRKKVKRVSIFRDPAERLMSVYSDHRIATYFPGASKLIDLAKSMGPGDFFRQREVHRYVLTNNVYFRVFATSLEDPMDELEAEIGDKLNVAEKRIRGLDAIGLTSEMEASVRHITRVLGIATPIEIRSLNVSAEKYTDSEAKLVLN